MLFPGHDRSQHLLRYLANSTDTTNAQEGINLKNEGPETGRLTSDSSSGERQNGGLTVFPLRRQKQNTEEELAQTGAKFESEWPNGAPPTGPRKHLQRTREFPPRRQSGVGDDEHRPAFSSLVWLAPRPPLPLTHECGVDSLTTTKISDKVVTKADLVISCSRRTESLMHNRGQGVGAVEEKRFMASPSTSETTQLGMEEKRTSDMQWQITVGDGACSPTESMSLLGQTCEARPLPQSSLTAAGTDLGKRMSLAMSSPKHPSKSSEPPDTSSNVGMRHRDITYVIRNAQRASSETRSVTSAASSVAGKSSSSSISSTLRVSVCHICKKPPFKEKLKGCSECCRHYHKGCAKPKDRITEENWVCRRCLNKLAKKSEPPSSSIVLLPIVTHSRDTQELHKLPKFTGGAGSMTTRSIGQMTTNLHPQSQPALLSENTVPPIPGHDSNAPKAGTRVTDQLVTDSHNPTATKPCAVLTRFSAVSATHSAIDHNTGTINRAIKGSSAEIPSYFNGWQAKTQEHTTRTSKDLSLSSPAVALSAVDHTASGSTNLAFPVWSNSHAASGNISNKNSHFLPSAGNHTNGHTKENQSRLPAKPSAMHTQLPSDRPAVPSKTTDLSSQANLASKLPSGNFDTCSSGTTNEAWRAEDIDSTTRMDGPESRCTSGPKLQPSDPRNANPEGSSYATEPSTRKANLETFSDSVLPIKRFCSQCRRLILGSATLCTKCRQARGVERSHGYGENDDDEQAEVVELLSKDQNTLPDSDVISIPETPEQVLEKTKGSFRRLSETAKAVVPQQKPPQKLVPQKRPIIRPAIVDDEHCFSKKKARIYKPVASVAVKVAPICLNKFPLTPKSGSPLIEANRRDASIQATVETADRGTSPNSSPLEVYERFETQGSESKPVGVRSGQDVSRHNAQSEALPFSDSSRWKLDQEPIDQHSRNMVERQAREPSRRTSKFEQNEAATARLQRPVQQGGQPPRQKSSAPSIESCKPEYDREVATPISMESHNLAIANGNDRTSSDEKVLLEVLKHRGVMFEEDDSSESEVEVPPPEVKPNPKNPLWSRPQSSTDLFLIAPGLDPNRPSFDVERKRKEIDARPSRKQRQRNMSYLRQERGDNIHKEVNKTLQPRMVKVSTTERSELDESVSMNGDTERRREVLMTFGDFIGAPAKAMAILTIDKQLAFRDGTRDSKGDLPRAREKFVVTSKSVACMES